MRATTDVEKAVRERYSQAAHVHEDPLCCPVTYDPKLISIIPEEIQQADYGCCDPSFFVREGDIVLDLGSGAGKICYIAAQIVGPTGRVIGIDENDEMLALAKKYQHLVGEQISCHNVDFRKGRIQNLQLDLELVDSYLRGNPVASTADLDRLTDYSASIRSKKSISSG